MTADRTRPMTTIGFEHHDHAHCITDAVRAAETHCAERGLRFTDVRRRVLEILARNHRAMGAYDILDLLRGEGLGSQPPVVYRALDFLVGHGFAHKIERLNAFVACCHPGADHAPAFLICRGCDAVAEARIAGTRSILGNTAREAGFAVERAVVEVEGLCPDCQKDAGH